MYEFPELLTNKEMQDNEIPLPFRDRCARLLIPLNKCRPQGWYLPWNCEHERHEYEKCQYMDFKRRVKELEAMKEEMKQQKENSKEEKK